MFVLFRTQEWNRLNLHFHEEQEVLMTLSEGGTMYINNSVYPISRGSLFVISNTDFHRSVGSNKDEPYRFCVIHFEPEEVCGVSTEDFDLTSCFKDHRNFNHHCQLNEEQLENMLAQIRRLESYLAPECPIYGKNIYSKICLSELLVNINSLYESARGAGELQDGKKPPDRISPVIQYIQDHYAGDLSLESIANEFFISKSHL